MPAELRLNHFRTLFLSIIFALVPAFVVPALSGQSPIFNGPRDYPVGSFDKVTVADFNGDGLPDMALANSLSNAVSVFLQNPDGTFQPAVNYSAGKQPSSVQAADINGDGKQDLIVINTGDNTLGVLLGNGDGTFQTQLTTPLPVTTPSFSSYPFMVLGDWNGDGKIDIALAGALPQAGSYALAVMLSKGGGTFQTPVTYSLTATPFALNAADFNSDGKLDLVTAGSSGVSVWLGNGDGTFKAAISTAASQHVEQGVLLVIADFNQDGHPDIATATQGTVSDQGVPDLTVFLGNGDGTFQPNIISSLQYFPLAVGDLNGDGKPDLIATTGSMTATALLNSGNATFTVGPSVDLWSQDVSGPITLAELNGDQKLDLLAGLTAVDGSANLGIVSVLYGNGDGSFAEFPSYGATTSQISIPLVAADFNNDGKPDLATAFVGPEGYSNIRLLLNDDAGFSPPIDTAIAILQGPVGSIAAGDFNGDGKMDAVIAIGYPSGGIFVLLGNGNGTFQTAVEYGQQVTGPLAVGDFNGDGKLDLLGVTDSNPGAGVSVLLGKGDGTFGFPVNTLTTISGNDVVAQAIAVADFNGDGKLDVAALVLNNDTTAPQQLLVLLGNGDGTFTVGPTYNAGSNPVSIAVGDFNGDGKVDLVVGNAYQGLIGEVTESEVAVLLGNGDGTFQAPIITTAGNGNYSVAVADFNLDGKADVILSDFPWSDISLLLGNGDGTFQSPMQFFLGNSLASFSISNTFAVADFDGNGSPDLAIGGTNGASVLLNAAGSHAPSPLLSTGTLTFGSVHMGQPASQTATLTNMATTALTVSGITLSGAQSAGFSQSNSCGTSLAVGLSCTIDVTFAPQAAGARTATIQIADNASNSPQVISLSATGIAAPSIGFGVPPGSSSSVTVSAGQLAVYALSIGGAGMGGTATLTCTGAPQDAHCMVISPITVSATTASTISIEVATSSDTSASVNSPRLIRLGGKWAAIWIGLVLVPTSWGKRGSKRIFLGALIVSLVLICSCGGGSSSSTGQTNQHGTPAGTYTLTVSATLNSVTETTTLKLTVQ